jgi:hypothetical protein
LNATHFWLALQSAHVVLELPNAQSGAAPLDPDEPDDPDDPDDPDTAAHVPSGATPLPPVPVAPVHTPLAHSPFDVQEAPVPRLLPPPVEELEQPARSTTKSEPETRITAFMPRRSAGR